MNALVGCHLFLFPKINQVKDSPHYLMSLAIWCEKFHARLLYDMLVNTQLLD